MVFSDLFSRNMALVSFSALCLMGLTGVSLPARAADADIVGPGCDPAFMKAMKSKAWMEAQREIMIAQSQIAKPDSVFALGCFGAFSSASGTGSFTGGTKYDISNKVKDYVNKAFAHPYGGGHYDGAEKNNGNNTDCGLMQTIWNLARCSDFDPSSKQFSSLQTISGYDRSAFPKACDVAKTATAWSTNKTTIYGTKTAKKSVGAAFDDIDMKLFTDKTAAVSLTSGEKCADGIPTGIKMGDVAEVICPNPGCYPSAGKCEKK